MHCQNYYYHHFQWYRSEDALPICCNRDQPIDETLFNLTFDADDIEELQDITNNYNIEYRVDGLLDLNDDKRVDLITADIKDTLEKDFDRQAF